MYICMLKLIHTNSMKISDLLNSKNVIPDLIAETKEDLLSQLVEAMQRSVGFDIREKAFTAVMERESIMSTGVGKGLAIPHGRVNGITTNYAAFASLQKPIEYGSIDGKPISMVFMLIGPETQNSMHIKLLSRISRLMNNDDFRESLKLCTSAEQILEHFALEENKSI
jgi:mannitol/fructose-specific phosphotransferase system IIA component (Ntr-type)